MKEKIFVLTIDIVESEIQKYLDDEWNVRYMLAIGAASVIVVLQKFFVSDKLMPIPTIVGYSKPVKE